MGKDDSLKEYHKKRDFRLSTEPSGAEKDKEDPDEKLFVIQKHEASSLHYDLRLLVDGVLKSWAVPKGPSNNPEEKRLAIPTEDHPIEYADFEGTIPEDQYGGGTVMVWDTGTYENDKKDQQGNEIPMKDQLEKGHCTFILNGKKLKGGYTLIRFGKGKNEKWFLKKVDDKEGEKSKDSVETKDRSVLTGRTMEEIKNAENQ